MKLFHISDILSITTGRLVSNRHIEGVYDILNFLTGDNLFTHQLPRASRECEPWLRTQFPQLFADSEHYKDGDDKPFIQRCLDNLDNLTRPIKPEYLASWVESVRVGVGLPEMLPVYEMGADMHTYIDPIEEAEAMDRQRSYVCDQIRIE